jgi:hypothetical protein
MTHRVKNHGFYAEIFSSFLLTMLAASSGFSVTGRVGVMVDGHYDYRTAELEPSDSPVTLSNAWIIFESAPTNLIADKEGCYCFAETDPRFSFVQAYY